METAQTQSILTVALMAAFADGMKDEREREAVRQLAEALGGEAGIDLPALYRDVLLRKPDLAVVAAGLDSPELRQYAYEMAVGVVHADGAQNAAEADFLARLAQALQVPAAAAAAQSREANELVNAALAGTSTSIAGAATQSGAAAGASAAAPESAPAVASGTVLGKANASDAELDQAILKASITNAALELLPETLASMAIIPLQMRLVHRIGQAYGYPMDRTNAKDFIATLGVGLTGQYLEQFGRKLLGGVLGKVGGGIGGAIGRQAASSGMSFATTYAIGRVAQRYYAGGRTMDTAMLKQTFTSLLAEARGLAPQYQQQITQAARTMNTRSLLQEVGLRTR
jgi:uncharacterized protein (DUF697 family)/tellurite resistance protein